MQKPQKQTYQILVNRYALFEFAVDANSHEEACKILQRELRSGELKKAKGGTEPVEAFWADPTDKGDAWAVMCATPEPVEAYTHIMLWNGAEVVESGFQPVPVNDRSSTKKVKLE